MITFPLMVSLSPAGTDESNCEHMITIPETGIVGGLRAFLEAPLTMPVTLVLLIDQGFRKFGFDHTIRRSFTDYLDNLELLTRGVLRYFTPSFPSDPYRNQNFNIVARYNQLPGGNRHRCLTANTSAAVCTKSRWPVESLFGRENQLAIMNNVPQQFLASCEIPGFESHSILAVYIWIGDSLLHSFGTPLTLKYPTVDTYLDHGNDIRNRMTMENLLSEYSGIQWSRQDIFRRPRPNEQTTLGQQVQRVFLLNNQQTGMTQVTQQEFTSVTLGSFQTRMIKSYGTHLRRKEVEVLPFVDNATNNQRLSEIPNPVAYIWDEIYPPHGPPGWDQNLYWPWENVRMILTFFPPRMRTARERAVIHMYKTIDQPPPHANPLGLRPASLQRLMSWCCGPARADACPVGERLVGCCVHCATSLWYSAVIPADPAAFKTSHKNINLIDRKNPQQMDVETVAEVS